HHAPLPTTCNCSCPERRKQWKKAPLAYMTWPHRYNCSSKAPVLPPRAVSPTKRARRDSSPVEQQPPSTLTSSAPPPLGSVTAAPRRRRGRLLNRLTPGPGDQSLEAWFL